jgi:CBS-domain-containing membrane protein
MRARDIMTTPVVTVTPETGLARAAELLLDSGFAILPVVDEHGDLMATVSRTDVITVRARPYRQRLWPETVRGVMTAPAMAVPEDTDVFDLARVLSDARMAGLPIVAGARVLGMVTRRDLLRVLTRANSLLAADTRRRATDGEDRSR